MKNLTPQKLGNYDIIERLGHGGMAEVYKGYHPALDRFVAIKVLHRHLSDDQDLIERFKLEARAVAKLQHPHIMRLIDFDAQGDQLYMVLEYLEGGTLKDYLKEESSLPPQEALRLATQLLKGLDYAHRQGMIHRDLKSANVLFMDHTHSHAVLGDFGLARILDETGLTVSGTILGTPSYMSPEAARGERLDERADIYSFGIVLYEMLTGTTPYIADTPYAVLLKHIQEPLPSPSQFNANISPLIEEILFKALAKKPDERFQSAKEFRRAIEEALQELESSSHIRHHSRTAPTRIWRASAKGNKKNSISKKRFMILSAVMVMMLLLIIAISLTLNDWFDLTSLNSTPIQDVIINQEEEDVLGEEGYPPPEEEPPKQKPSTDISHDLFDEDNPDPTVLLYSHLASSESIEKPTVGIGGVSHLQEADFVKIQNYHGVLLEREGEDCKNQAYQMIRFPIMTEEGQNINFDEGEIELWYRPNYDSNDVSRQRVLVAIGYHNIYNPPTMLLEFYDRLTFSLTQEDYTSFAAETAYAAALWKAQEWVHIRATWDRSASQNALQLFVNGKHVNQISSQGGWNMESNEGSPEKYQIFIGTGTECGDFIADGIIDEILIRNKVQRIN